MKTFLRVVEVWVPSSDRSLLEFGGGAFGPATALRSISRFMCFGRAEGLPGRVWDAEQAVLLTRLEGSTYRRSGAARAAGLGCAVGMPIYAGSALVAVVVFYGAAEALPGAALELWGSEDAAAPDLSLTDGCYLGGAASMEAIARGSRTPRGSGLPGTAWARGESVFIADLPHSPDFERAGAAGAAGLQSALALPCAPRGGRQQVLGFLGSAGLPIARRIESWAMESGAPPDGGSAGEGTSLSLRFAHAEAGAGAVEGPTPAQAAAIDSAYFSGLPAFVDEPFAADGASLAAIPIVGGAGAVTEVLAFYL